MRFDELIGEGKRLAESGPMELEISTALARLDELIELVHQLDEQIEGQENRVFGTKKQFAKMEEQVALIRERLGTLERRADQLGGIEAGIDPTPIIVS